MERAHRAVNRVSAFTKLHPLVGPICWMLSVQYLITTGLVAMAWTFPYDWKNHFISDLGNTECGVWDGLYVCSPQHFWMNLSFIIFGITIAAGAALIYTEFKRTRWTMIGFMLMFFAGIGTILAGAFPENTIGFMHAMGAFLALSVGNLAIIVLALSIKEISPLFRIYSVVSGSIALIAFVLFVLDIYLGLGKGGMERVVSYLFTIWMIVLGLYMTAVRVEAIPVKKKKV